MKNLIVLLVITAFIFTSCNSIECDTEDFNSKITVFQSDIQSLGAIYLFDDTTENCTSFKNVIQDYVDFLESEKECEEEHGLTEDFDSLITEFNEVIDSLNC